MISFKRKKKRTCFCALFFTLLLLFSGSIIVSASSDKTTYNGHLYQRIDKGMTWTQARDYCESLGGHLVTITSSGEQQAVQSLIAQGTKNQYWLGGQVAEKRGTWITGEVFSYSNWGRGEPNNYRSSENYIQMYRIPNPHSYQSDAQGKWNDISNDNHISGEEDFFTTDQVGLVCEFDNPSTDLSDCSVSLSKTSYTYNGKARKPSVTVWHNNQKLKKNKDFSVSYADNTKTGKATVTISGKGNYTGSVHRTFYIYPAQASIKSLKSSQAGNLTVSWKALSGDISGYQIRCSKKKNFSSSTSKKVKKTSETTFSGLDKGKKYYVQVRAYKNTGSSVLYGKWSSKKSVTVADISIKLDKKSLTITTPKSRTANLSATVTGNKDNKKIKWKSSNQDIVTVKDGIITASGDAGTATVTASIGSVSASCQVTVKDWIYVTKKIAFDTLEEWMTNMKLAEKSLFPITSSFKDPVSGKTLMSIRIIRERKVLKTKTINHTYTESGKKKTISLKCPCEVKYKIYLHIHNFKKGYGNSFYFGDGGTKLINQCSCGYRSEWTWEIPDITDMDKSQTTASTITSLPQNNK